jgi:hypothetical protein
VGLVVDIVALRKDIFWLPFPVLIPPTAPYSLIILPSMLRSCDTDKKKKIKNSMV